MLHKCLRACPAKTQGQVGCSHGPPGRQLQLGKEALQLVGEAPARIAMLGLVELPLEQRAAKIRSHEQHLQEAVQVACGALVHQAGVARGRLFHEADIRKL